jgi:predicted CXXCH cytochrome family protein
MALLAAIFLVTSCAYRHYVGMHGPSVKKHPLIHADYTADPSCQMCHDPRSSVVAPKTNHPNFTGCLKCHNDDLTRGSSDRRDKTMGGVSLRVAGDAGAS